MPMPLNKNKIWPSELLKIPVQIIVFEGSYETRISSHQIVLVPEEINREYFLLLFVDGIRQQNWKLSSQPHRGKLQRGGRLASDEIFYVHGLNDNRHRYRFIFINPASLQIGTADEIPIRYARARSQRPKKDRDVLDFYQELFGMAPRSVVRRMSKQRH
jgi:hypothetical protein